VTRSRLSPLTGACSDLRKINLHPYAMINIFYFYHRPTKPDQAQKTEEK